MNAKHTWLNEVHDNSAPLFFILGPCAMENEAHVMKTAQFIKELAQKLNINFIFKSSFDKANRTSVENYRSVGIKEGLRILAKVAEELQLPVITDVHECWQIPEVGAVVDVLQIPAFLCRQTDLLVAAGKTDKPVFVKKGQFLNAEAMALVAQKVASTGNEKVWLGERGYTFGYQNLVVDYRNFPIMKETGRPVILDATHSVQRPGGLGGASGGDRRFVPPLAAAAVVQGIAGVFMEVHEEPERALSDGPNSIRLSQLADLIGYLKDLDAWAKQQPVPAAS